MLQSLPPRPFLMYSGERFNGLSHLADLILALFDAAWLIARTLPLGDAQRTVGALVFAGTVTPFALGPMNADGWHMAALTAVWSLAGIGIWHALRSSATDAPPLWLYIGMGWIGVLAALRGSLHRAPIGLALLLGGAVLYTVGTICYRNRSGFRHAHGIWHLFVLGGTTCHYLAIGFIVL